MLQKQPLRGLRSNKFSNISAYKTKVKPLLTAVVDKSEKKHSQEMKHIFAFATLAGIYLFKFNNENNRKTCEIHYS